jgi:hypothetical protein
MTCLAQRIDALESTGAASPVVVDRTVLTYPSAESDASTATQDEASTPDDAAPDASPPAVSAIASPPELATEEALVASMEAASDDGARIADVLAHPNDFDAFDATALQGLAADRAKSAGTFRLAALACYRARSACAPLTPAASAVLPARKTALNLIDDPGFERQTIDHTVVPPWLASTEQNAVVGVGADLAKGYARSGKNNGFVYIPGGNALAWGRPSLEQTIAVKPHTRYLVSGWFRTELGVTDAFAAARTDCAESGTSLGQTTYGPIAGGPWRYRAFEFDAGEHTSVAICLGLPAPVGPERWMQVDDVTVSEVTAR